ncbi:hypothetical protein PGT21_026864 [Puccinia graminis f. sp. tritici]|uniref:Uncharacterized protein n=1 Tax=Puccinia graminis f. sp. tritici TaxID=56615 RepID=A0A5B0MP67_PUCGR|nr:hypothetical protein PGT21_026864 [Puccinia graminis f. sp. tritici]
MKFNYYPYFFIYLFTMNYKALSTFPLEPSSLKFSSEATKSSTLAGHLDENICLLQNPAKETSEDSSNNTIDFPSYFSDQPHSNYPKDDETFKLLFDWELAAPVVDFTNQLATRGA